MVLFSIVYGYKITFMDVIYVLGAISPGPSLAVVIRNTISGGRTSGVMTGLGHGLGLVFMPL